MEVFRDLIKSENGEPWKGQAVILVMWGLRGLKSAGKEKEDPRKGTSVPTDDWGRPDFPYGGRTTEGSNEPMETDLLLDKVDSVEEQRKDATLRLAYKHHA